MGAGLPVHQVSPRNARAHRHSRSDALGNADNVRLNIVMLRCEHLARPSHPALNFVSDKQNAMFVADSTQAIQKSFWRWHIAAFTLNRFDDYGSNFFRR